VPENADPAAIRHALRALAVRYHPDAGSGSSAQRFRDVAEAYSVLSIPNDGGNTTLIWRGAEFIATWHLSR
jgi:curved DNA-binding protein CbpA